MATDHTPADARSWAGALNLAGDRWRVRRVAGSATWRAVSVGALALPATVERCASALAVAGGGRVGVRAIRDGSPSGPERTYTVAPSPVIEDHPMPAQPPALTDGEAIAIRQPQTIPARAGVGASTPEAARYVADGHTLATAIEQSQGTARDAIRQVIHMSEILAGTVAGLSEQLTSQIQVVGQLSVELAAVREELAQVRGEQSEQRGALGELLSGDGPLAQLAQVVAMRMAQGQATGD